jgi:glycosyltransferase involved in cell wall biosynthesis
MSDRKLAHLFAGFLDRNEDENQVKIGIDARFLTHPQKGGFKTYTENLCMALSEVDFTNEYVFYLDRPPQEHVPLPSGANISYRIVQGLTPGIGMVLREQIRLPRCSRNDGVDLLHSPCLTSPLVLMYPRVVTIHDMIWQHPAKAARLNRTSARRTLMRWYYQWMPMLAARTAAIILTVSEFSKHQIIGRLGIPPSRVIVTHEAPSRSFRRVDNPLLLQPVLEKYRLAPPFILGFGSSDPRKNTTTLMRAYSMIAPGLREKFRLAIIMTHSSLDAEFIQQAQTLGVTDQVRFLQSVPDEDMVLLYNAATLFAFPSLEEGFGLPVLEAMACGTPVVAANNSSFPEVAGDAAILVEARDADAICSGISAILTQKALQEKLRTSGIGRAGCFSWESCARQTILGYEAALQNSRGAKALRQLKTM